MDDAAVEMRPVARIRSDFPTKFGIPRQSGLVRELRARIIFEPEFRDPEALRGLEGFSHIWLLWVFSGSVGHRWSPTVRPPRLGGNTRMGVFATRSPFRPNPLGLSSVRIEKIDLHTDEGPVIFVSGADLMDGTPILDIKPYVPYADSHPDALGGFANTAAGPTLRVTLPEPLPDCFPPDRRAALEAVLAQDPRPSYQDDPESIYGLAFAGCNIRFRVEGDKLTVLCIEPL